MDKNAKLPTKVEVTKHVAARLEGFANAIVTLQQQIDLVINTCVSQACLPQGRYTLSKPDDKGRRFLVPMKEE